MRKHASPRQASPDDPMFGEIFIFSVSDPPPRIRAAADALDVGTVSRSRASPAG